MMELKVRDYVAERDSKLVSKLVTMQMASAELMDNGVIRVIGGSGQKDRVKGALFTFGFKVDEQ